MSNPPRLRDRFKRRATEVRTLEDRKRARDKKRLDHARDQHENAEDFQQLFGALFQNGHNGNGNGHATIYSLGAKVRVVRVWRGFNSRFLGRVGYVVARHPPGTSFDVAVKFVRKKNADLSELGALPGVYGDFRSIELQVVRK